MFVIDGNRDVYHTRGDTGKITLDITTNGSENLAEYSATLSVKKKLTDSSYLLQKVAAKNSYGDYFFEFEHEDTQSLKAGSYYYDIQITAKAYDESGNLKTYVRTLGPLHYNLLNDVTTD